METGCSGVGTVVKLTGIDNGANSRRRLGLRNVLSVWPVGQSGPSRILAPVALPPHAPGAAFLDHPKLWPNCPACRFPTTYFPPFIPCAGAFDTYCNAGMTRTVAPGPVPRPEESGEVQRFRRSTEFVSCQAAPPTVPLTCLDVNCAADFSMLDESCNYSGAPHKPLRPERTLLLIPQQCRAECSEGQKMKLTVAALYG